MNYRWVFRAYDDSAMKQSPALITVVVYAIDYEKALEKAKHVSGVRPRKTYDLINVTEMSTGA